LLPVAIGLPQAKWIFQQEYDQFAQVCIPNYSKWGIKKLLFCGTAPLLLPAEKEINRAISCPV